MGNDLWEEVCLGAVNYLLAHWPDWVKNGVNEAGLSYGPLSNLALPDVKHQDLGAAHARGVCGVPATESGDAFASLTGMTLNGLDSLAITSGQAASFTTPDTVMSIPLTIQNLTITGNFEVQQACSWSGQSDTYTISGTGTFTASTGSIDLVITVSGLDADTGVAGAVSLAWASAAPKPKATCKVTDPPGMTGQPSGAPKPNKFDVQNLAPASDSTLATTLSGLIAGTISISSGQTLPGEILALINEGFQEAAQ